MISLFPKTPVTPSASDDKASAINTLRQSFMAGGGLVGGGTVIFAIIELMKSEPDKAFKLLDTWGPWFILALFSVWAANGLLQRGLTEVARIGDRVCNSFDAVAVEQKRLADSQDLIAQAAQQTAQKDDRERERLSTLVEYTGTQSREAKDAIREMQPILMQMSQQLNQLSKKDG